MADYKYDKSALKGLGVGPFLNEVKLREAKIAEAPAAEIQSVFNANKLAAALHPAKQFAKVVQITDHGDAKTFVLAPDQEKGTEKLAYFRAGQYVSLWLTIDGVTLDKPYTLQSGPSDAQGENGCYAITVKHSRGGFSSEYILSNWAVGTEVTLSGPKGDFYYQSLRDAKHVIALAGGSGITPFCAMASAIANGEEDFDLTILYGSRDHNNILLSGELLNLSARAHGKVKVINVLSDEDIQGFEHGFLSAELIRKYAPQDEAYSLFVCGPKAMYAYEKEEIAKLGIPAKYVRFELSGEYGDPAQDPAYPAEAAGKVFELTVIIRGEEQKVSCKADQSMLKAMEAAGIRVPSDCRSGKCGWCHSRLVSGEVFVPAEADGRRAADKKFGWIHPCCSYALSDCTVEVFPL